MKKIFLLSFALLSQLSVCAPLSRQEVVDYFGTDQPYGDNYPIYYTFEEQLLYRDPQYKRHSVGSRLFPYCVAIEDSDRSTCFDGYVCRSRSNFTQKTIKNSDGWTSVTTDVGICVPVSSQNL